MTDKKKENMDAKMVEQMCKQVALGMAKYYLNQKMISNEEYLKMVKYIKENNI